MPPPPMTPEAKKAYNVALKRIQACLQRGKEDKELDLSSLGLAALPPEIGQLTALTTINLRDNQLSTLPPEIGQLKDLRFLSLSYNQLKTLPSEFARLENLEILWLDTNRFTRLPTFMGSLSKLKKLSLAKNRLSSLSQELRQLNSLEALYLHGNPRLKLPLEVLGWRENDVRYIFYQPAEPKTILDYYFGRRAENSQTLNEVKLILVGRGGAGKTSIVRALQGLPIKFDQESTQGIALCDWAMRGCKGWPVTAHVWDFPGQVITHALHPFFFSVRSVYVLVLTGRENREREDAEYWLRLIRAFGRDENDTASQGPPVIVALNQWDKPGCRPTVDRGALQERYPFIAGFVEMDCLTRKGVAKLQKALCKVVDKLKWIREPFKPEWAAVRKALYAAGKRRQAHLPYAEYRALCARHGVTDLGEQDSLSDILHNLGAALNYRDDPCLRETTVLQPLWLTKNVYGLMRRAEKQFGVLKQADVDAVLSQEKDVAMRQYLVQLMERFEIAYAQRSSGGGVWLVPQALPIGQPKEVESFGRAADATRLRYTYQALPEMLIARVIVRLHEFIAEVNNKKQQWADGAILSRKTARALISQRPEHRQIIITVTGLEKDRRQLAGLCQAEMRDIHKEIPWLGSKEETQVGGAWLSTATLEADERKGRLTGFSEPDQGTIFVDPAELNDAYSEKLARSTQAWKPTIFVSYSKSDVAQRKRLESELKILRNEGLLESHWHDRMIDPGDEWNETIQRKLREADVIVILVSTAALSTDYITEHEIPKAVEFHKASKAVVVPIILESCMWNKTELNFLNALPSNAKPLNKWRPYSDGWFSIGNGLASLLQKLIRENRYGSALKSMEERSPAVETELNLARLGLKEVPPDVWKNDQLISLNLQNNQLSILPPEIGELTSLKQLILEGNALIELPESIKRLRNLQVLTLHGNDALGLPAELLGPSLAQLGGQSPPANPQEILKHYFTHREAAQEDGAEPLMEAKVLVLGEASVGKSCLIAALGEGKVRKQLDGTGTSGIIRTFWDAPVHKGELDTNPKAIGTTNLRLNFWDFGGQEIYHSAHTLFLTRRAIYLIVVSKRESDRQNNLDYWLRMASGFGGADAITYVVVNKDDEKVGNPPDENVIRLKYPHVRGFLRTSCDDLNGIPEARQVIVREALHLEGVRLPVAKNWLVVKRRLETMREHTLSMREWDDVCGQQVPSTEARQELLHLCDRLGTVRYFPTTTPNAVDLCETAILNPEWVTLGIYSILDDETLRKKGGILNRLEMREILKRRKFPVEHGRIIEEVMRRFFLLYDSVDHGSEHRMLIPLMLPERMPDISWLTKDTLEFVYQYDVMPSGLIPAFMARMHKDLSRTAPSWRHGCVLELKECQVKVTGDIETKQVRISINGAEELRQRALDQIRFTFESLHEAVENLPVQQLIPVPGYPDAPMLDYEFVRSLEWKQKLEFETKGASFSQTITVNVRQALDGVRGETLKKRDEAIRLEARSVIINNNYQPGSNPKFMNNDNSIQMRDNYGQVGQILNNCTNIIKQLAPNKQKEMLEELDKQVRRLIELLPAEKREKAPKIARDLHQLVEQSSSSEPEREWYSLSAKGVMEAATWVKDLSGEIAGTIKNLGKSIWSDFQLPEI